MQCAVEEREVTKSKTSTVQHVTKKQSRKAIYMPTTSFCLFTFHPAHCLCHAKKERLAGMRGCEKGKARAYAK